MTRIGTNHFYSVSAATAYYRSQGDLDASETVRRGLLDGTITAYSKPIPKGLGQKVVLDTVEGRYYLEEP